MENVEKNNLKIALNVLHIKKSIQFLATFQNATYIMKTKSIF